MAKGRSILMGCIGILGAWLAFPVVTLAAPVTIFLDVDPIPPTPPPPPSTGSIFGHYIAEPIIDPVVEVPSIFANNGPAVGSKDWVYGDRAPDYIVSLASGKQLRLAARSPSAPPLATPIPGALLLFGSVLGLLTLVGWRRKRKLGYAGAGC